MTLAKDQRLSLNPAQISGGCGRLLCCLRYEHEFYVSSRKRFPKEGKRLRTGTGVEVVAAVDIFRDRIMLKAEDGATRIVALAAFKEEVSAAPPSDLVTLDEADSKPTQQDAVEAVTPRKQRKHHRHRKRGPRNGGRSGNGDPSDASRRDGDS